MRDKKPKRGWLRRIAIAAGVCLGIGCGASTYLCLNDNAMTAIYLGVKSSKAFKKFDNYITTKSFMSKWVPEDTIIVESYGNKDADTNIAALLAARPEGEWTLKPERWVPFLKEFNYSSDRRNLGVDRLDVYKNARKKTLWDVVNSGKYDKIGVIGHGYWSGWYATDTVLTESELEEAVAKGELKPFDGDFFKFTCGGGRYRWEADRKEIEALFSDIGKKIDIDKDTLLAKYDLHLNYDSEDRLRSAINDGIHKIQSDFLKEMGGAYGSITDIFEKVVKEKGIICRSPYQEDCKNLVDIEYDLIEYNLVDWCKRREDPLQCYEDNSWRPYQIPEFDSIAELWKRDPKEIIRRYRERFSGIIDFSPVISIYITKEDSSIHYQWEIRLGNLAQDFEERMAGLKVHKVEQKLLGESIAKRVYAFEGLVWQRNYVLHPYGILYRDKTGEEINEITKDNDRLRCR